MTVADALSLSQDRGRPAPAEASRLSGLVRTIWLEADASDGVWGVYLIDQTRLPLQSVILCCRSLNDLQKAIQSLAVRGAPALGVAAAMGLAIWAQNESEAEDVAGFLEELAAAAKRIATARPTAVNLSWGAARLLRFAQEWTGQTPAETAAGAAGDAAAAAATGAPSLAVTLSASASEAQRLAALKAALIDFAREMASVDERTNRAIGARGAPLLAPGSRVLTICNTGSLATAYFGTALGVVYTAWEQGRVAEVWACETRPLNQGSRLTLWELMRCGIPATLIADSMAATCMATGRVDCVLVGADRICANGDAANKIGTLSLAVLAAHFGLPFYVVAPRSSIDASLASGTGIEIEQRDARELAGFSARGLITPASSVEADALRLLTEAGA
ncbi:MAG: S-methyl-5-thioribose-1-phosphate isomerase, partial [Coriobacteriales bacterium]|nr:S-methyl-5-thioribose-1-phosphate isomerase [Coriobacteriales bacterium]